MAEPHRQTLLARRGAPGFMMRGLAAACLLAAAAVPAWVHAAPAAADQAPLDKDAATAWLSRVQASAREHDYSGIVIYQQGPLLQSSLLIHVRDGTGERERMLVLDGEPREFLRHNETVQYVLPQRKLVKLEQGGVERFPSLLQGDYERLLEHYVIRVDERGMARIAGRPCQVAHIEPRDEYRYAYRVCVDDETGLLLKAQVLSEDKQVLEQNAFARLDTGADVDPVDLRPLVETRDWPVEATRMEPASLASQGWRITPPPGFTAVMEVQRNVNHRETVSQLVLSDGLAAFSIFIEPLASAARAGKPVREQAQRGATNIYGVRIADYWLTAVGEVPADALAHVVDAIEYVPGAPQ